jgi:acyl-CoA thioester hydrolase
VYATYLEQARAAYFADVVGEALEDVPTVLVQLEIEYERPISGQGTVEIDLWIPELGTSSIPMEYELRGIDGNVSATASTVQVHFDRETDEPAPIPEAWRAVMNEEGSQQSLDRSDR